MPKLHPVAKNISSAENPPDGRSRILQAAFPLFAERGFYGVSISDVAESAGLVKSAIYHHFANKEELYIAVLTDVCNRVNTKMEACARGKDWKTRLHNAVATLAKEIGPGSYLLNVILEGVSHVTVNDSHVTVDALVVLRETLLSVLTREIKNGIAAGDLRPLDPFMISVGLIGLIASTQAASRKSNEERANFAFDLFLQGTLRRKKSLS